MRKHIVGVSPYQKSGYGKESLQSLENVFFSSLSKPVMCSIYERRMCLLSSLCSYGILYKNGRSKLNMEFPSAFPMTRRMIDGKRHARADLCVYCHIS